MSQLVGLPVERSEEEPRYEPGRGGLEGEIAKELLEFYLKDNHYIPRAMDYTTGEGCYTRDGQHEEFIRCTGIIQEILEGKHYEPERLIDAVVFFASEITSSRQRLYIHRLLDPLVQTLYHEGHNALSVDVTPLPNVPYRLASHLTGSPEHPLQVYYHLGTFRTGDVYPGPRVAIGVSHCKIEFDGNLKGDPIPTGICARESEIIFLGRAKAGFQAEDCTFYISSLEGLVYDSRKCRYYLDWSQNPDHIQTNSRRLRLGLRMLALQAGGFFWSQRNTLYLPKEGGEWRRVIV